MRQNNEDNLVTKMDVNKVKEILQKIYLTSPTIHLSFKEGRKKYDDVESTITAFYNHFCQVKSHVKNYHDETFTINYIDIVIGKFRIREVEEMYNKEEN